MQASTYIYRSHLSPFFQEHEQDIDAFLASSRSRAGFALVESVGWIWQKAKAQFNVSLFFLTLNLLSLFIGTDYVA